MPDSAADTDVFATDSILPPPPEGGVALLHNREYRVQAYRVAADRLEIHGAIRDQKPPGLYIQDDPEPLTVHHMQLALEIAFPALEIVGVTTEFETHPHESCPRIIDHYDNLIGLSIARGFTHKVRELFGGPRGCTHTTALLQAMAPVAMQCFWAMRAAQAVVDGEPSPILSDRGGPSDTWHMIVNTCHVWDEDGEAVAQRKAGAPVEAPVFMRGRLEKLGLSMPDPTHTDL